MCKCEKNFDKNSWLGYKKKVFFDYLVSSGSPAGGHFKAIQIEHSGTLDTD